MMTTISCDVSEKPRTEKGSFEVVPEAKGTAAAPRRPGRGRGGGSEGLRGRQLHFRFPWRRWLRTWSDKRTVTKQLREPTWDEDEDEDDFDNDNDVGQTPSTPHGTGFVGTHVETIKEVLAGSPTFYSQILRSLHEILNLLPVLIV